jgi:polyhydroxybutyrate depolymerase
MYRQALTFLLLLLSFSTALPKDKRYSFAFDGVWRTYRLHLPPQYDGETPLPLVINMHSFGTSAGIHIYMSQMDSKADEEGFIVAYPNGTGPLRSWNADISVGSLHQSRVDDVGFIDALIDTLIANYVIDTLRIYAAGFSNGGMMAYRLVCELSDRIAAIASVAGGLMFDDCICERAVPIIHFHARDDPVVPYYNKPIRGFIFPPIDSVMQGWAERNGCDAGPDSVYTEDKEALRQRWWNQEGIQVVLWTTEKGEHTWPSGKGVPFPGVSTPSRAISANDLIWEFFENHPLTRGIERPQHSDRNQGK